MAARKRRRTVKWNAGEAPAQQVMKYPLNITEADIWEPKEKDLWAERLIVGAMWRLRQTHGVQSYKRNNISHELNYVSPYNVGYGFPKPLKVLEVGSIATYTGQTRVTESSNYGGTISVLRHTFIIDGVRYMTFNLNVLEPVI